MARVRWEKLKCVPGAKQAAKRSLEKSVGGRRVGQGAELNNNKKRQSQQTLNPQS